MILERIECYKCKGTGKYLASTVNAQEVYCKCYVCFGAGKVCDFRDMKDYYDNMNLPKLRDRKHKC